MKIKLILFSLVLSSLQMFATGEKNQTAGHGFVNKDVSNYPEPKYVYFKDIQDEELLDWPSVIFDDLKKHNKLVATGDGYNYKIIKFRLCVFEDDNKRKTRLNDNFFDFTGDSIGPLFFSKLDKNRVYTFSIEEVKVATTDSQIITFRVANYYKVFPDSTYLLADRYYPKTLIPRKAKHDIRISLEGDVTQEDKEILKKIVADYNSVLSTIKVKIVKHFPTIRIVLNKKVDSVYTSNKRIINTSSNTSQLFFPELKIQKDGIFYSVYGLKSKSNQHTLYNEIADALNSFDKIQGYSKSNIIGENFQRENISSEAWARAEKLGLAGEELHNKAMVYEYENVDPGLTHEDKLALKIMFSPGYDKIINDIYNINKEPISTYFLLIIIFSIIVFIMGYELFAYFNIERFIRSKFILNSITILLFVQCVIAAMYLFLPFHPAFLDPLWKYNIYFSIYAVLCTWLFFGSDMLQNKIKIKALQFVANPVITLAVLFLAYQIIYLFICGERLQFQTIDKDAMIIGFTIVAVRFYLFYEQSKIVSLMQEKEYELTRHKELQNRAELNALQARINPHFLYNALNSIAELVHIDAKRTEKMVLSLSKLFQYNVNREGRMLTTLGEEIEMVKVYLEIEKQRLGERLNFKIDVDNSVLNKEIPRFLIQPLVENAIKHGISKLSEKGEIALHCYEKNEKLVIEVYDNGPAFPKGINSGYGLQNTYEKLNIAYNKPYEIKFVNEPEKYLQIVL
jgi:hypothetical protein